MLALTLSDKFHRCLALLLLECGFAHHLESLQHMIFLQLKANNMVWSTINLDNVKER